MAILQGGKHAHLVALHGAQLADVRLHELGDLVDEDPEAAHGPAVQHDGPPHRGVAVLHQHNPFGVPVKVVLPGAITGTLFRPGGPLGGMCRLLPIRLVLPTRGLVTSSLCLCPWLADVASATCAAAILQRLLAGASGRDGLPGGLAGGVIHYGIETMVAAFVGGHFVPSHTPSCWQPAAAAD